MKLQLWIPLLSVCGSVLTQTDNCISAVDNCLEPNRPQRQASNSACESSLRIPLCIAGSNNVCQLNETDATFEEVIPLLRDTCNVVAPLTQNVSDCQAFTACLIRTSIFSKLNPTNPNDTLNPKDTARLALSASFWCSYASDTLECITSTAKECSFPDDATKVVQNQLDKAKATCGMKKNGARSSQVSTLSMAVVVACTLVTVWVRG